MTISIIANTAASYAQSGMRVRNDAILASTQKLSSGLRVFSAKEDSTATAVGTSLKIENSSLKTAILNASSGASALQITDGAMGQISDIVTRMISLANQASSGHLDDSTRSLADTEFQNLKSEVDRISRNTSFGGVNLLAGSKTFTVASAHDYSVSGISDIHFDQDLVSGDSTFRYSYDASTEVMTMTRIDGATTRTQTVDLTALLDGVTGAGQNLTGTERLDIGFSQLGIGLTLTSSFARGTSILPDASLTPGSVTAGAPDGTHAAPYFTPAATGVPTSLINGLNGLVSGYVPSTGVLTLPLATDGTVVQLGAMPGISYKVGAAAATASGLASNDLVGLPVPTDVMLLVDTPGGGQATLGTWTIGAITTGGAVGGSVTIHAGKGLLSGTYVDSNGPTRLTYKIGTGITTGEDTLLVNVPSTTLDALDLTGVRISNPVYANDAVNKLQAALTTINQGRATVGAQQLRLEEVSQNLTTQVENNESARSALLDVDVAKEITELTSNQAMMQAASAMLAKANQMPAMLIDLLKNS